MTFKNYIYCILNFYLVASENSNCDDSHDDDDVELGVPSESGLMFVYQTAWMKRLLDRYGQEMILLDATYKTTRYALPLFFVVVKTNVGYQVVATFVIEGESTRNIQSALDIIKQWNPEFKPKSAMVDCCREEFNAIESIFPGNYIVLSFAVLSNVVYNFDTFMKLLCIHI